MKKNKRNGIKHILAMIFFCMVLNMGMVSLADVQGTVIAKSAVIRAAADSNSERLASIPSGKTIDIIAKTTGTDSKTWYQVYVNSDTKGFVRGDLVKVPDGADIPAVQGGAAASSTDAPATTATPVDARQVTVISNNTNIRVEASTESASRAKVNRGMVLTVVGEATGTDGKTWYQVTFTYGSEEKTGYIRSDLVTTDNVPNDPATSQITGEENPGEEQPAETAPPEEQPQPEQPADAAAPENSNNVLPMNVDEVPYIMPGFELITLNADGAGYNAYRNGQFLIFYGQKQNGEQGWYLFDTKNHIYQNYVYTEEGVTQPSQGIGSVGLIPVIVLVVIIVILVAVVGLLLIKLKGQGTSYKRYKGYDDDDDQDDDIEDLEDLEDDDDEPQPVRRPQGPQPVRRPQPAPANGSAPQGGQPPRRPQSQQPPRHQQSQQPPRRQQGNPANGNAPQGGQPPRRPQGGNSGGGRPQGQPQQPPRRPQGNPNGQPPRRPQPQNERVPNEKGSAQRGHKAKNLLDDDMDFMDIE